MRATFDKTHKRRGRIEMKRLIVAVVFVIGFAGYAAGEDLMEKEMKILTDQYTAASGYGATQLFASNFRN